MILVCPASGAARGTPAALPRAAGDALGCRRRARASKVRLKWARLFSLAHAAPASAQAPLVVPAGAPAARLGSESQYSAHGGARRGAACAQAQDAAAARARSDERRLAQNLCRDVRQHHQACLPLFQEVNVRTARAAGHARGRGRRARAKTRAPRALSGATARARPPQQHSAVQMGHPLQVARRQQVSLKTARAARRARCWAPRSSEPSARRAHASSRPSASRPALPLCLLYCAVRRCTCACFPVPIRCLLARLT